MRVFSQMNRVIEATKQLIDLKFVNQDFHFCSLVKILGKLSSADSCADATPGRAICVRLALASDYTTVAKSVIASRP